MEITTILVYSPKKKKAKDTPECSVKKPATNSDSASGSNCVIVKAFYPLLQYITILFRLCHQLGNVNQVVGSSWTIYCWHNASSSR